MATFTNSNQNLTFDIPDDGEVFQVEGQGNNRYVQQRVGNTLYTQDLLTLGARDLGGVDAVAKMPGWGTGKIDELVQKGLQMFQQQTGVTNIGRRSEANAADFTSFFDRTGGFSRQQASDLNVFRNVAPRTGEQITQSTSAVNPYGADITSSTQGSIFNSPSIQETLMNAGANAELAAKIGAKAVAGQPLGGVANALSPQSFQPTGPVQQINAPGATTGANSPYAKAASYTGPSIVDFLSMAGQPNDFASRTKLAEQSGIKNYTGTAEQNTQLLGILRGSANTGGAVPGQTTGGTTSASGGTVSADGTPTGKGIMGATGMGVNEYIRSMEASLVEGLADARGNVKDASNKIYDFFSNRKSAEDILRDEYARRGIEKQSDLLSELDKRIREQSNMLKNLPENIQRGLENVGVTQGQLQRLTLMESKKPTELLNELLGERNALASDIERAMKFADKFADTILADQAAMLSAYEFELNRADGDLSKLEEKQKDILKLALDDKKDQMELALELAKLGGTKEQIDAVLNADSLQEAVRSAGPVFAQKANAKTAAAASTRVSTNKITLAEAQRFGFPKYVVGMSEEEISQSFSDPNFPKWFQDKMQTEQQQSIMPNVVQTAWTKYRQEYLSAATKTTTTSTSQISNPFN